MSAPEVAQRDQRLALMKADERAARARARLLPRRLVKIRCGGLTAGGWVRGCGDSWKLRPHDVPERCPRCGRTGGLFVVKWMTR